MSVHIPRSLLARFGRTGRTVEIAEVGDVGAAGATTQVVTPAAGHVSFDVADGPTALLFITAGTALTLDPPDNPEQGQRFALVTYGDGVEADLTFTEGGDPQTGFWNWDYTPVLPVRIRSYEWGFYEFVYTEVGGYGAWTLISTPPEASLTYVNATPQLHEIGAGPTTKSTYAPPAPYVYIGTDDDDLVNLGLGLTGKGMGPGQRVVVGIDNKSANDWTVHIAARDATVLGALLAGINGLTLPAGEYNELTVVAVEGALVLVSQKLFVQAERTTYTLGPDSGSYGIEWSSDQNADVGDKAPRLILKDGLVHCLGQITFSAAQVNLLILSVPPEVYGLDDHMVDVWDNSAQAFTECLMSFMFDDQIVLEFADGVTPFASGDIIYLSGSYLVAE